MTANCLTQSTVKHLNQRAEKLSCECGFGIESGVGLNQGLIENQDYLQVELNPRNSQPRYFGLSNLKNKKNNLVSFSTQNQNCFFSLFETVKNEIGLESNWPYNNTLLASLKSGQIQLMNIA